MQLLHRFVYANRRWSRWTERRLSLPNDGTLWTQFARDAAELIRALPDGATVLDLGGGRRCEYASAVEPSGRVRLVAVDIAPEELAMNTDVDETLIADVGQGLPVPPISVDLILSRTLLEHVADVPSAIRHMARALKPGGTTLHLVPGRYALFAIAARVLPFDRTVQLLHRIMPWTVGQVEFAVHYDHCDPRSLEDSFRAAGFSHVELSTTWAQPGYFEFFYPLFLLHAAYEWCVRHLRLRQLSSYTVVRATR